MAEQDPLMALGDIAVTNTQTIMAHAGQLPLASYILAEDGVRMLVAGAHDDFNKRMFAAVTKVAGARHRARCTAVVMETSRVTPRNEGERLLLDQIRRRGDPISAHPAAVDRVIVVTTDGLRQDVREYEPVRHHPEMVGLELIEHLTLEGDERMRGELLEMHALPEQISLPAFQSLMQEMQQMGLLDGTPVANTTPRRAN